MRCAGTVEVPCALNSDEAKDLTRSGAEDHCSLALLRKSARVGYDESEDFREQPKISTT